MIEDAAQDAAAALAAQQQEMNIAKAAAKKEIEAAAAKINDAVKLASAREGVANAAAAKNAELAAALAVHQQRMEASRAAALAAAERTQLLQRTLEEQQAECDYLRIQLTMEIDARKQLEMDIMQADAVTTAPGSPSTAAAAAVEDDASQCSCEPTVDDITYSRTPPEVTVTSKAVAAAVIRLTLESIATSEALQTTEMLESEDDVRSSLPAGCSFPPITAVVVRTVLERISERSALAQGY
jgi:hypothetical protein